MNIGWTPAARARPISRSALSTARRIPSRSCPLCFANHPPSARKSFWTSTTISRLVAGWTRSSGSSGCAPSVSLISVRLRFGDVALDDLAGLDGTAEHLHGDAHRPRVDDVLVGQVARGVLEQPG